MADLATRLSSRRSELGLNKLQLATLAGVHHSIISRIESGGYQYSRHLFDIADVLEVSVDWLVRGKGPDKPASYYYRQLQGRVHKLQLDAGES